MTELLQRVIAEIEKLPEDEQDAIATRLGSPGCLGKNVLFDTNLVKNEC